LGFEFCTRPKTQNSPRVLGAKPIFRQKPFKIFRLFIGVYQIKTNFGLF
jgi:hypothetical protein